MDLHFDVIAPIYDQVFNKHIADYYLQKRIDFLIKQVPNMEASVLDFGCGTGTLAKALKDLGLKIAGVDISEEMMKIARSKGLAVSTHNNERLPFEDETYDLVYSVATFHHLVDSKLINKVINELVRVTKPNGKIIIWDHNAYNLYWPILMRRLPQDSGNERIIKVKEFIRYFNKLGIQSSNIKITYSGFVPDFAPEKLMNMFRLAERLVEVTPVRKLLAAHNVIQVLK